MTFIEKIKHHFYDFNFDIPFLVVITGQKCTLKCKKCANFSPYHSEKIDFYDMNLIINDLKNIIKRVRSIKRVQLQGGDFFLHKDADLILDYISNEPKIKECVIATNCIIIPNQSSLDILKNEKFLIRISDYKTANEINEKKLCKVLDDNKIRYCWHCYANGDYSWSDCGDINIQKISRKETKQNYLNCVFKICLTLENGIISRCSRATVAHLVQKFIPSFGDFINVRSPFFNIHDLKRFIRHHRSKKGIVKACYYCNGTSGAKIPAGEQFTLEEFKLIKQGKQPVVKKFKPHRGGVIPIFAENENKLAA